MLPPFLSTTGGGSGTIGVVVGVGGGVVVVVRAAGQGVVRQGRRGEQGGARARGTPHGGISVDILH